ncbi:hypothetical protein [Staphylococcus epidermidis]|uniref:hypothetical protein n=1 Tax=Staphylococcus epidermidis TaxID=1282 RepID=UPI0011AB2588|nr:hypothetical protein [Staphylococcus epidermidis]
MYGGIRLKRGEGECIGKTLLGGVSGFLGMFGGGFISVVGGFGMGGGIGEGIWNGGDRICRKKVVSLETGVVIGEGS